MTQHGQPTELDETPTVNTSDIKAPLAERFPTIDSLIAEAYHVLDPVMWDFLAGGSESETTLRRNRSAMDRVAFRPRLLRGVHGASLRSSLLGVDLAFPVLPAPMGSLVRFHPDGGCVAARAAGECGTLAFLSSAADPGLEAVRADSDAPIIWQLYVRGDRQWLAEQLTRAQDAGCTGICLTVDVTAPAHRARNLSNRFGGYRPGRSYIDDDFYRYQAEFAWPDVEWLSGATALPVVVKGITCGEDASEAVEHGAAAVYVSNHGGRQLDHLPGTLEVLPEVVAAVGDRTEVIVDGGFVNGSDVVKALALGANAVAVGKLMGWALAAAGEPGLRHAFTLLCDEIAHIMPLLGVGSVTELSTESVGPAAPAPSNDWIGFAPGRGR